MFIQQQGGSINRRTKRLRDQRRRRRVHNHNRQVSVETNVPDRGERLQQVRNKREDTSISER